MMMRSENQAAGREAGGHDVPGVTIREFAESMKVAYQTVQRWIDPGGMPVLGWLEIGGRRFVRLDPQRCREWALANRPALAGVGPGGWRPGSGRLKGATKPKGRLTRPRGPRTATARADGVTGTFVPNSTAAAAAAPSAEPAASAPVPAAPPPNPYLEARMAALIADVKVKELKYQQLAGKVLDKAEVEEVWNAKLREIASLLRTIAPGATRELAAHPRLADEALLRFIEDAIEQQIVRVRAALANTGETAADAGGLDAAGAAADGPVTGNGPVTGGGLG